MQENQKDQEYRDVELKLIDEPDGRIRLEIDAESIIELAENIKEVGQIQPIKLAIKKGRFEIVAGHRRFLAIKNLGLKTIKAVVSTMTEEDIALQRASENLLRTDLTPIEEGATYANLAEKYNMSLRKIGDKFSKAASTVKRMIDLLALEPDIQKAIHNKLITIAVGEILNQIDESKQRAYYLRTAIENGCSAPTAEEWLKDFQRSSEPGRSVVEQGVPLEPAFKTEKIYTACEICQEPVDYRNVKVIRTCPGCYRNIVESLNKGGE